MRLKRRLADIQLKRNTTPYNRYIFISTIFLALTWLIGIVISNQSPLLYEEAFAQEDGPIENLTNIFLIGAILLMGIKATQTQNRSLYIIGVFALIFVLGEEISWGQRLLDIQVSDSLSQLNSQKEFNLHNMKPAGIPINKWVFGKLLTVVIFAYLLGSFWALKSKTKLGRFMRHFEVPVAWPHHSIGMILLASGLLFVSSGEKWELYELTCVVTFCSILLKDLSIQPIDKITSRSFEIDSIDYQEIRVAS